jgi:hypothetical protein
VRVSKRKLLLELLLGCLLDKSCKLLLRDPAVLFRLASPGLVTKGLLLVTVASQLLVGKHLAILGVMGEVGPMLRTEEGRFLLVARGRVALLLGVLVLGLGFFERFFDTFESFHEVDDLEKRLLHGIKSLSIHLILPRLGSPEQADINQFVIPHLLESSERREVGNFLGVDSDKVLVISANLHVLGLLHVSTQTALDLSQDLSR